MSLTLRDKIIYMSPTRINNIRERLNLSLRLFAVELGVTKATIYRWECGTQIPKGRKLERLFFLERLLNEVNI